MIPLTLLAFSPAKARSSTGIPWKSESWMGFPHMLIFSILCLSMPRAFMTLFSVSMRIPCATSFPTFMQNVRWSMTLAPGRGWHSVVTVDIIFPSDRSTAWALDPLVPMSIATP